MQKYIPITETVDMRLRNYEQNAEIENTIK